MATTDAPKPTFAQVANCSTKIDNGDEDDSGRKGMAEKELMAANVSSGRRGEGRVNEQDSRLSAMLPRDMTIEACNATDIE